MKQSISLICLFLLTATQVSCTGKTQKTSTNNEKEIIQNIETPVVSKDTIVKQVVIIDTIKQEVKQEVVKQTPATPTTSKPAEQPRPSYQREERQSNSSDGFFDGYKENFTGDPNKDLKPVTKVVVVDEALEKKKKLEEAIKKLEEKNKEQQETQKRVNKEIEEYNKQVEEENKAKDEQQQQVEQKKGKTLDTDLLIK